jgi:hypothetical protein
MKAKDFGAWLPVDTLLHFTEKTAAGKLWWKTASTRRAALGRGVVECEKERLVPLL